MGSLGEVGEGARNVGSPRTVQYEYSIATPQARQRQLRGSPKKSNLVPSLCYFNSRALAPSLFLTHSGPRFDLSASFFLPPPLSNFERIEESCNVPSDGEFGL